MAKNIERATVADLVVTAVLEGTKGKSIPAWYMGLFVRHYNYATGKRYKGINPILLALQGGKGEYLTMKQLMGYNTKHKTAFLIKKGTKSKIITFSSTLPRKARQYEIEEYHNGSNKFGVYEDDRGELMKNDFVLRKFNVFDINDIADKEGNKLPSRFYDNTREFNPFFNPNMNVKAEELESLESHKLEADTPEGKFFEYCEREIIDVTREKGVNYYSDTDDLININPDESWSVEFDKISVMFHEAVHSTGSETRLNRRSLREYSDSMSRRGTEEFVAELGSLMCLAEMGYPLTDVELEKSVEYITGWATWIAENKEAFIYACSASHYAVDFILGENAEEIAYDKIVNGFIEGNDVEHTNSLTELEVDIGEITVGLSSISTNPLD